MDVFKRQTTELVREVLEEKKFTGEGPYKTDPASSYWTSS